MSTDPLAPPALDAPRISQERRQQLGARRSTIGFEWAGSARRALAGPRRARGRRFAPNAFVRIGADDSVTVISKHVEMGQGAYTGIATIVAEELDADWTQVRVESAPADAKRYANLAFGTMQGTGGSSAMANSWMQLREAGAKARAMLLAAAAKRMARARRASSPWRRASCTTPPASGRRLSARWSREPRRCRCPRQVTLKDRKEFKLIGRQLPRVDAAAKSDGTAQFTLDVVLPGHAGGAAEAAAAVRRDGQVLRCHGGDRGTRRRQSSPGAARRRRGRKELLGRQARAGCAQGRMGRSAGREAQLRRPSWTSIGGSPTNPRCPRARTATRRGDPDAAKGLGQLRIPVPGSCADGAARCRRQAQCGQLRDLGGRSIPDRRSGQCRAYRRARARSR